MRLKRVAAAAGILAVLAGAAQAEESLGGRALRKLFPGKFQAVVRGIVPIDITARGDGSLFGRMRSKTDTGRWSIESGQLCILFERWMNGKPSCSEVVWDGQWYRAASVKFRKI